MSKKNINFIILIIVFFAFGFVTCLNGILTSLFKETYAISNFEANLVSFAFFLAYFIGSLFHVLANKLNNKRFKIFHNLGYKKILLFGLIVSAIGNLAFALAVCVNNYFAVLVGLFIIGLGFAYLQISANPLIITFGEPQTGASRINLAQAFNSFATALAPTFGVAILYNYLNVNHKVQNLLYPYLIFALIFLVLALLIYKLLTLNPLEKEFANPLIIRNQHKLIGGMLAIFCCVGVEVSISSNLMAYLKDNFIMSDNGAGELLALHWGGFVIGRFLASIALSKISVFRKVVAMVLCSVILTSLLVMINGSSKINLIYFGLYQLIAIIAFISIKGSPRANLSLFAAIVISSLFFVILIPGNNFTLCALVYTGLFNSVMFPTIFDLALNGLGKAKEYGSSLLVMMIVGGAIFPLIQGRMADLIGINLSFIVPGFACFYIIIYGLTCHKLKSNSA